MSRSGMNWSLWFNLRCRVGIEVHHTCSSSVKGRLGLFMMERVGTAGYYTTGPFHGVGQMGLLEEIHTRDAIAEVIRNVH